MDEVILSPWVILPLGYHTRGRNSSLLSRVWMVAKPGVEYHHPIVRPVVRPQSQRRFSHPRGGQGFSGFPVSYVIGWELGRTSKFIDDTGIQVLYKTR